MLYRGQSISAIPNIQILVIPHGELDIVIKAKAILDYDDHDKLNPRPVPPTLTKARTGEKSEDYNDKKYVEQLDTWAKRRLAWITIKSLEDSEIIWETIVLTDHTTWENYIPELKGAGFTPQEVGRILDLVGTVNSLDQKNIDDATSRFLAGQE